jgi:hypothetical protein
VKYRYLIDKPNYSDYASGKVLLGLPGQVATPLRLVDELFQSGLAALRAAGVAGPVTLYDPCCGTAYHLAALAFWHWPSISTILASDIRAGVLVIAQRNLRLLTLDGLDQRAAAIQQSHAAFGKDSHQDALAASRRLRGRLEVSASRAIETRVFESDAFDPVALIANLHQNEVSLVLSDLPYGQGSRWQSPQHEAALDGSDSERVIQLLDALLPVLLPQAVICLLLPKTAKIAHNRFRRIRQFHAGKRLGMILQRSH